MNISFLKNRIIRWILVFVVFMTATGAGAYYYTHQETKLTFHPDWTEIDRRQMQEIISWVEINNKKNQKDKDERWREMVDSLSFESLQELDWVWEQFRDYYKDHCEGQHIFHWDEIVKQTARTGDARYVGKNNWSLLHFACGLGKKELACHLMEKGADVNNSYQNCWDGKLSSEEMPLHFLIGGGRLGDTNLDVETILFLMDKLAIHGADFNARAGWCKHSPLELFYIFDDQYTEEEGGKILSKMIDLGTDVVSPTRRDKILVSPFCYPVESNSLLLVRRLCEAGTDTNEGYDFLPSLFLLFHYRPHTNMFEMARLFLDHGARINDRIQRKPGDCRPVRLGQETLSCSVELGQTPLSFLCLSFEKYPFYNEQKKKSYFDTFYLFLERGADVNLPSADGTTPLMYLFKDKKLKGDWDARMDMVRVLLKHGADPTLKNKRGETVMDFIRTYPLQGKKILEKLPELQRAQ